MPAIYQPDSLAKSGTTFCTRNGQYASRPGREHGLASSRQVLPEPCSVTSPSEAKGRREGRAPAGTRDPCALEMHTGWITGDAGRPAFPARMVLTVSFVLSSGSDALLPPSSCGWLMRAPGRAATSPQDLTHRLRASGPHDFSVRGRPRLGIEGWRVLTPGDRRTRCDRTVSCRVADDSRLPALSPRRPRRRCRVHRNPARIS
jgi:hypothetical protein